MTSKRALNDTNPNRRNRPDDERYVIDHGLHHRDILWKDQELKSNKRLKSVTDQYLQGRGADEDEIYNDKCGNNGNDEDENASVASTDPKSFKTRQCNVRRKIKMEYIQDKSRRHITFSKRKTGIMKKAYEFTTLTGTQILLMIVSETGLVYTFATPKLQPIVSKAASKSFIRACLTVSNKEPTPDPAIEVNQVEQVYVKEKLHRDDRSLSLTRYQDMDVFSSSLSFNREASRRHRAIPQAGSISTSTSTPTLPHQLPFYYPSSPSQLASQQMHHDHHSPYPYDAQRLGQLVPLPEVNYPHRHHQQLQHFQGPSRFDHGQHHPPANASLYSALAPNHNSETPTLSPPLLPQQGYRPRESSPVGHLRLNPLLPRIRNMSSNWSFQGVLPSLVQATGYSPSKAQPQKQPETSLFPLL